MSKRIIDLQIIEELPSGSFVMVDSPSLGSHRFDLSNLTGNEASIPNYYDEVTQRYAGLGNWFRNQRTGEVFEVDVPHYEDSSTVDCTKAGANANLVVTPSTATEAGRDDTQNYFTFWHKTVNGGADSNGSLYITAFRDYDPWFDLYGANGNVFECAPVLYYSITDMGTYDRYRLSDTPQAGLKIQPGGTLPDGSIRPFMLYPKYWGGWYDGKLASVAGVPAAIRTISHNSLITQAAAVGSGYSGKSIADDWYVKIMFLFKYGKKSSQAVFAGVSNYNKSAAVSVAESDVKRIILANSDAEFYEIGSCVSLGTGTDRGVAANYSVFDNKRIIKKEAYDTNNMAIYVDITDAFSTDTSYNLTTMPWSTGALDSVLGSDGTLTAAGRTNGHEPFMIQGIECMGGIYEVLSGVIVNATNVDNVRHNEVYITYDTANDSSSSITNFIKMESELSTPSGYTQDIADAGGLLIPIGYGAASNTGTGDYHTQSSGVGLREFLGLGNLSHTSGAGLFSVHSHFPLSGTYWHIGSRLSVTGRSKG